MMNMLVVDDQKHIRDGLQTMLRQFPLQFDHIYTAATGIEALNLLRSNSIQLVVTDIKMPDMDGLSLMAATKEENIGVDYIIISGYSEFAFAQQAIGLGAKSYLLKPVKREDLFTAVEQVLLEVKSRKKLARNMEHIVRQAQETEKKELHMFMQGAHYDEEWIGRIEQQKPELWSHYRLCLLRKALWINQPESVSAYGLESIVYQLYDTDQCIHLQHQPHLIFAVDANIDGRELPAALGAQLINTTTVMTAPQQGVKELPIAYKQLLELYHHSYLFPDETYVTPAHIESLTTHWEMPYEKLYDLFRLIGTENSGKISEGISSIFHKRVLQRYRIQYTVELCQAMVQMLEEHERVIRPYMGEEALDIACLRHLFDYPSIRDYIQALQKELLRLNQFYYEFKCSYNNTQDLNEAILFIHENYHKPLDLAVVSNHVSLNYSYFSNLFKKNIGKGFSEYLRDVRLDKARRLLAETDHKISEVAAMVGYESYKSFTRAFREVMRMQPTEYRHTMRRK